MTNELDTSQCINKPRPALSDVSAPEQEPILSLTKSQLKAIILDEVKDLTERLDFAEKRLDKQSEYITALQYSKKATNPSRKSDDRKKRLADILVARKNAGITYSEIGKILELGTRQGSKNSRKQNMTHFGKILVASEKEFVVTVSKTEGGKLVKLTNIYYNHLINKGAR